MHCPNCAAKASDEQKFCRSCGLRLEKVHLLLSEELSTVELHAQNKIRRFEHWRNVAFLWTAIAFFILLLAVFVREMVINFGARSSDFYAALIGLVLFLGVSIAVLLAAYSAYLKQKMASRQLQTEAAPTAKLPPESSAIMVPSVAEVTTEILQTDSTTGGNYGTQSSAPAGIRSGDGQHAEDARKDSHG